MSNTINKKIVLMTGFTRFAGREYPEAINTMIRKIFLTNHENLAEVGIELMDVSEYMNAFVNDPKNFGSVAYNSEIPHHEKIVLIDLFRLKLIKDGLALNPNIAYGWIDADLIITNASKLANLDTNTVCNVFTYRPEGHQADLSNGLMIVHDKSLVESWIARFKDGSDSQIQIIGGDAPKGLDFSFYSRGILADLVKTLDIKSLGDVISFTSYHDINDPEIYKSMEDAATNLVGVNLSLSWNLDNFNELFKRFEV